MIRMFLSAFTVLALAGVLLVAPSPQISQEGEVSIGHAVAEASHQPCRPSYWTMRKPSSISQYAYRTQVRLRDERVRGGWVNCRYSAYTFGVVHQSTWTETRPHR